MTRTSTRGGGWTIKTGWPSTTGWDNLKFQIVPLRCRLPRCSNCPSPPPLAEVLVTFLYYSRFHNVKFAFSLTTKLSKTKHSREYKTFPSREQMVIVHDSARILQKLPILQDLAEKRLSCKIPEKAFRSSCPLIDSHSCNTFHFEQKST